MNTNNQVCLLGFYLLEQHIPICHHSLQQNSRLRIMQDFILLDNKARILVVNIKTMTVSLQFSKYKRYTYNSVITISSISKKKYERNLPNAG